MFGRPRHHGEGGDHVAVGCVIGIADLVVVLDIGVDPGHQRHKRAPLGVAFGGSIEAILLTGRADDLLRVFQHLVAVAVGSRIVRPGVNIGAQQADCGHLATADAAVVDLLDPGRNVLAPALLLLEWALSGLAASSGSRSEFTA